MPFKSVDSGGSTREPSRMFRQRITAPLMHDHQCSVMLRHNRYYYNRGFLCYTNDVITVVGDGAHQPSSYIPQSDTINNISFNNK